jgi:hypothetical protein
VRCKTIIEGEKPLYFLLKRNGDKVSVFHTDEAWNQEKPVQVLGHTVAQLWNEESNIEGEQDYNTVMENLRKTLVDTSIEDVGIMESSVSAFMSDLDTSEEKSEKEKLDAWHTRLKSPEFSGMSTSLQMKISTDLISHVAKIATDHLSTHLKENLTHMVQVMQHEVEEKFPCEEVRLDSPEGARKNISDPIVLELSKANAIIFQSNFNKEHLSPEGPTVPTDTEKIMHLPHGYQLELQENGRYHLLNTQGHPINLPHPLKVEIVGSDYDGYSQSRPEEQVLAQPEMFATPVKLTVTRGGTRRASMRDGETYIRDNAYKDDEAILSEVRHVLRMLESNDSSESSRYKKQILTVLKDGLKPTGVSVEKFMDKKTTIGEFYNKLNKKTITMSSTSVEEAIICRQLRSLLGRPRKAESDILGNASKAVEEGNRLLNNELIRVGDLVDGPRCNQHSGCREEPKVKAGLLKIFNNAMFRHNVQVGNPHKLDNELIVHFFNFPGFELSDEQAYDFSEEEAKTFQKQLGSKKGSPDGDKTLFHTKGYQLKREGDGPFHLYNAEGKLVKRPVSIDEDLKKQINIVMTNPLQRKRLDVYLRCHGYSPQVLLTHPKTSGISDTLLSLLDLKKRARGMEQLVEKAKIKVSKEQLSPADQEDIVAKNTTQHIKNREKNEKPELSYEVVKAIVKVHRKTIQLRL